jgi:hypothetical protein
LSGVVDVAPSSPGGVSAASGLKSFASPMGVFLLRNPARLR